MRFQLEIHPEAIADLPRDLRDQIGDQIHRKLLVERRWIEQADYEIERRKLQFGAWQEIANRYPRE